MLTLQASFSIFVHRDTAMARMQLQQVRALRCAFECSPTAASHEILLTHAACAARWEGVLRALCVWWLWQVCSTLPQLLCRAHQQHNWWVPLPGHTARMWLLVVQNAVWRLRPLLSPFSGTKQVSSSCPWL